MIEYKNNTFYLHTKNTTYCMKVSEDRLLVHSYYGASIPTEDLSAYTGGFQRSVCFAAHSDGILMSMDELPQEYGCFGRGDNRMPAIKIENDDGRTVSELRYCSHRIGRGVSPLPEPMPQLTAADNEAMTLIVSMEDVVSGVTVELHYTVFEETDIIARHTVVLNSTDKTVYIQELDSAAVDFPARKYELITLYGAWGRERWIERYPLHHGIAGVGSTLGEQSNTFFRKRRKALERCTAFPCCIAAISGCGRRLDSFIQHGCRWG